jgi:hypothetical protein
MMIFEKHRIRLIGLVLLLVAAIVSSPSYAKKTETRALGTGNDIFQLLESNDKAGELIAYYYIQGVVDAEDDYVAAEIVSAMKEKREKFRTEHFCLSKNVTMGQVADIYRKYLANNPEHRHASASRLLRFVLLQEFPCARNP